jgi:hypothetical protein
MQSNLLSPTYAKLRGALSNVKIKINIKKIGIKQ